MHIRSYRLFLIFILTAIFFSGCEADHTPPVITKQEFPFRVEFSLGDEVFVAEDSVVCEFDRLDHNMGHKSPNIIRHWKEYLKSEGDGMDYYKDLIVLEECGEKSIFKNRVNNISQVCLTFGEAEYYMGESEYGYLSAPCFYYYEFFRDNTGRVAGKFTILTEEQLKEFFDIEIIEWSFSEPIVNTYE